MKIKRWILLSVGAIGLPLISAGVAYSIYSRDAAEPTFSNITSTPVVEPTPKTVLPTATPSKVQGASMTQDVYIPPSPNKSFELKPSCVKSIIPFKTTIVERKDLYNEETYSTVGVDGSKNACTDASLDTIITPAVDKVTYYGTKIHSSQTSYANAMNAATSSCSQYGDSSTYDICIDGVLGQYGY